MTISCGLRGAADQRQMKAAKPTRTLIGIVTPFVVGFICPVRYSARECTGSIRPLSVRTEDIDDRSDAGDLDILV